jgi:hypothetical protein
MGYDHRSKALARERPRPVFDVGLKHAAAAGRVGERFCVTVYANGGMALGRKPAQVSPVPAGDIEHGGARFDQRCEALNPG